MHYITLNHIYFSFGVCKHQNIFSNVIKCHRAINNTSIEIWWIVIHLKIKLERGIFFFCVKRRAWKCMITWPHFWLDLFDFLSLIATPLSVWKWWLTNIIRTSTLSAHSFSCQYFYFWYSKFQIILKTPFPKCRL